MRAGGLLDSGAFLALLDLEELMERYEDRPMDFADATLVHVARREGLQAILSIDDDFLVYRIEGRRQFQVYPPC